DALLVERHALLAFARQHRVVGPDFLNEAAVARAARVGDHDVVERALLGAVPCHADGNHSWSFRWIRCLSRCQRGKPGGSMLPRLRINPFSPSLFTLFIIFSISACCFRSLLISGTPAPEPAAIRRLREAWMMSGLRRSFGVIDRMIASCRLRTFS